ncbi:glycosyltransferase [Schaalia sp. 19OD2882]|uniref:glycosyltransferase n=1 Tax=Schaalia sp. 19OD2882 TaxID=2794089 RepID=UPI001C1E9647|nr:glycosyltransferase [Schaalia sp. 19OD2882]QWW20271.1 glycosyltransferase [Schaalia sp. 19OD2882]
MAEGLHVLWLPSWYPSGPQDMNGSFFREQCRALAEAGVQVGVLAPHMSALLEREAAPSLPIAPLDEDGVQVLRFVAPQIIQSTRVLSTWRSVPALMAAFDAYVQANGCPDVIHAHSLYPGAFLAAALSTRTGIPWILTEHRSLSHMRVRTPLGAASERRVVASAARRTGVSIGHAAHLEKRFGSKAGVWEYLPNLLPDMDLPAARARREGFVIGHLSVLDPVKRVDLILRAFEGLHPGCPEARLRIGGPLDTPFGAQVQTLVAKSPAREAVELVGSVSRADIGRFYADIDLFVMPSDSESFGVAFTESLAAGTPVVATATWGGLTIVGPGDGSIVPIGDCDRLAAAIREHVEHPTTADERRSRAQRCMARFGKEAFASRWLSVYEEVVA